MFLPSPTHCLVLGKLRAIGVLRRGKDWNTAIFGNIPGLRLNEPKSGYTAFVPKGQFRTNVYLTYWTH